MAFQNLSLGIRQCEPFGPVDFRKLRHHPRARRPLHPKVIAGHRFQVDVGLNGPGSNNLATGLLVVTEMMKAAFDFNPEFFAGFTPCCVQFIFVFVDEALGDRPGAYILLGPIGSPGWTRRTS